MVVPLPHRFSSIVLDCMFKLQSGQTKDHKIGLIENRMRRFYPDFSELDYKNPTKHVGLQKQTLSSSHRNATCSSYDKAENLLTWH